jgi:hypothetical protein
MEMLGMVISRPDLKAMNLHLHHPGFSLHRVDKMENLLTVNCFLCLFEVQMSEIQGMPLLAHNPKTTYTATK